MASKLVRVPVLLFQARAIQRTGTRTRARLHAHACTPCPLSLFTSKHCSQPPQGACPCPCPHCTHDAMCAVPAPGACIAHALIMRLLAAMFSSCIYASSSSCIYIHMYQAHTTPAACACMFPAEYVAPAHTCTVPSSVRSCTSVGDVPPLPFQPSHPYSTQLVLFVGAPLCCNPRSRPPVSFRLVHDPGLVHDQRLRLLCI